MSFFFQMNLSEQSALSQISDILLTANRKKLLLSTQKAYLNVYGCGCFWVMISSFLVTIIIALLIRSKGGCEVYQSLAKGQKCIIKKKSIAVKRFLPSLMCFMSVFNTASWIVRLFDIGSSTSPYCLYHFDHEFSQMNHSNTDINSTQMRFEHLG